MNPEERQKIIDKVEAELEKLSDSLFAQERHKPTPSYLRALKAFEGRLQYYERLCARHEELLAEGK